MQYQYFDLLLHVNTLCILNNIMDTLQISDPEDKIHDVMIGIASGVNQQCLYCELEYTNITNGEFQCFPGSPNQVTFRAKVHDRAQATAREVITHTEQWTTSSDVVTLPVYHARLKINSSCIALLTSFDDPECPGHLSPPSQPVHTTTSSATDMMTLDSDSLNNYKLTTTAQPTMSHKGEAASPVDTKQPQSDVGAIVGGAVAIVLLICITTGVVMIAMFLYSFFKLKHIQTIKQRYQLLQLCTPVLWASPSCVEASPGDYS